MTEKPCGCKIEHGAPPPHPPSYLVHCPKHAAVDDLIAALEHTRDVLHGSMCQEEASCVEACDSANDVLATIRMKQDAIRKAKGSSTCKSD